MLSDFVMECATLLRDIRFGMGIFGQKVVSFSFTLDWFLFLHFFFLQARKMFECLALSFMNKLRQARTGRTHIFIDHLFCQSVLLTFSVKIE